MKSRKQSCIVGALESLGDTFRLGPLVEKILNLPPVCNLKPGMPDISREMGDGRMKLDGHIKYCLWHVCMVKIYHSDVCPCKKKYRLDSPVKSGSSGMFWRATNTFCEGQMTFLEGPHCQKKSILATP